MSKHTCITQEIQQQARLERLHCLIKQLDTENDRARPSQPYLSATIPRLVGGRKKILQYNYDRNTKSPFLNFFFKPAKQPFKREGEENRQTPGHPQTDTDTRTSSDRYRHPDILRQIQTPTFGISQSPAIFWPLFFFFFSDQEENNDRMRRGREEEVSRLIARYWKH